MVTGQVQRLYDEVVSVLSPAERLRLVELITRGLAVPEEPRSSEPAVVRGSPGWHVTADRRTEMDGWRDRAL